MRLLTIPSLLSLFTSFLIVSCQTGPPEIQFIEESTTVPESGGRDVEVCVVLLDLAEQTVTASLEVIDATSTATVDEDFEIIDEAVTFVAGSQPGTSQCFTVAIFPDVERENDETVVFLLLSNDIIVDETSLFTITIEEDVIVGFQEPMYSVFEGRSVEACVQIFSGVADEPLLLQMVSLLAGDAEEDDIEQVIVAVIFPEGSQIGDVQCVEVFALRDSFVEDTESLFLGIFEIDDDPSFQIDDTRMVIPLLIFDNPNIPTANVGFVEPEVEVLESQDVRLICLLFTTTSPLEEEVKASVTSSDGTAMSFSTELDPPDYLPVSVNIAIPSGTQNGTYFCVSVTIVNDDVLENTEDFTLNVESLSLDFLGVRSGAEQTKVYILDNEPPTSFFRFELREQVVREDDEVVTVCLEMVSAGPLLERVIFFFTAQNGTATEVEDFTLSFLMSRATFPAGSRKGTSVCGRVFLRDDRVAEPTEYFTLGANSDNETVGLLVPEYSVQTVSIIDDDVLYVGFFPLSINVTEDEMEAFVCVEVVDTEPLPRERRVRIATADGTALAMEDYTMQQTELIYPPGTEVEDVQCLAIPILNNNRADETRKFSVRLASFDPLVRVVPELENKTVYILDDEASQVEFEMSEYLVLEGAGYVTVCVRVIGDRVTRDGQVRVLTEDGTATAGFDYSPINEILAIPVGISRICVNITIIDDGTVESKQSFGVILISETPYLFTVSDAGRQSTVTIIDDEATQLPQITFETSKLSVNEDVNEPVIVCIQLVNGYLMEAAASVDLITQEGTATAGMDFTPFVITITLPAYSPNGTRSCTAITIQDDEELEEREHFSVRIDNLTPYVAVVVEGEDELIVHILDNDSPMLVVGFQVIYSVVDEAVGNKFTCLEIFSGGPLDNNASVLFYTRDGSAVAPTDYESVSTTLTFRAGTNGSRPSDAVCINVPIIDDNVGEETERFTLNIEAIDVDRIRVDEERSQKILYIEDNDVVRVGFDQIEFFTREFFIDFDLGLLVCVTVEDVLFPFTLITTPEDGTAQEILDYRVNNAPLQFVVASGNQTQCAYVQTIQDDIFEVESFRLLLSSENSAVVVDTANSAANITIVG